MYLVRVEDMALARQAVPSLPSEMEGLNAGKRNADRICIVAVRRKGLAVEMRLEALDAGSARRDPDTVAVAGLVARRAFAQSFKTGPAPQ
jgi:hypothetical protein